MRVRVKNKSSWVIAALLLLFAGAFLVRVWGMSYFHYWDEWVYLQDAKVICCGKTNYSELLYRPPLLSLIFAGVLLVRDHIFAACVVTAALNALGPVFLFLAGRRVVGVLPAALASLLLGFGPFFVGAIPAGLDSDDTGNSLLTDSPALTLVLLALWLMLLALGKQRLSRFALAGFALALAVLMRFGSIPSVGLLCLLPLLAKDRWKALGATAVGLMTGLGPYFVWSRIAYGGYFRTLREGWRNADGPHPPFSYYLMNAPAIFSWIGLAGLVVAAGLTVVALYRSWRGRAGFGFSATPGGLQGFLWFWLVADLVFFSLMPHKEPRYVMPLAPPLLLLAGSGLAMFYRLPGRVWRPVGVVLLAGGMVWTVLPSRARLAQRFVNHDRPEEILASSYLESAFPAGTTLYMNYDYPAFAYATNFRIHELPIGGPEVYREIDRIPGGGVLIAYRKNESGEPRIEVLGRDAGLRVVKEYGTLVIYQRMP